MFGEVIGKSRQNIGTLKEKDDKAKKILFEKNKLKSLPDEKSSFFPSKIKNSTKAV